MVRLTPRRDILAATLAGLALLATAWPAAHAQDVKKPPAELQKIRAAVQPVVDRASRDIGTSFVQGFYAEIDAFRKRP